MAAVTADDDLSIQLKRFLRPGEAADSPALPLRAAGTDDAPAPAPAPGPKTPTAPPPPAIDPALLRSLVSETVQLELDSLRTQLNSVFDEMAAALTRQQDEHSQMLAGLAGQARAVETQQQVGHQTLDLLAQTLEEVRRGAATVATATTDAGTGDVDALAEQIATNQQRLEKGLTIILRDVSKLRDEPVEVDVRGVEDAATRGALQNAADISTLQRQLTGLTEAVHRQDKHLSELRSTLDWIKERLLLR